MKKVIIALMVSFILLMNYGWVNAADSSIRDEEVVSVVAYDNDDSDDDYSDDDSDDDYSDDDYSDDDYSDDDYSDDDYSDDDYSDDDYSDDDYYDDDYSDNDYYERTSIFKSERKLNEEIDDLNEKLDKLYEDKEIDLSILDEIKFEIDVLEKLASELRAKLRAIVLASYTQTELDELDALKMKYEAKKADDGFVVLDVDSIITNGTILKFDMLPVIKDGRTLVPVRVISEGFQADVKWIQAEKKVIITKEDSIIELIIGDDEALVNGVVIDMDSEAEIMNNRTMVPLRFIAESLGLTIEWNSIDETIEIINEAILESVIDSAIMTP